MKNCQRCQPFCKFLTSVNRECCRRNILIYIYICLISDQLTVTGWNETAIDVPIHFVDLPPIKTHKPLPTELLYGSMLSGWTYTSLVAKQVRVMFFYSVA